MSADVNIVVLEQGDVSDPRAKKDAKGLVSARKVPTRVVLHRDARRVYVETEDGKDAVGATLWRRIDHRRRRREARCAYEAVEHLLATFYERAIMAEGRVVAAEARAAQAEMRARAQGSARSVLRFQATQNHDPHAAAKTKLTQLLALATAPSASENEARNAAVALAKLLGEHSEIIR